MLKGFRYILIATAGVLLCGFVAVFALRQLGLQQKFSPHKHPLLNLAPIIVADGGSSQNLPSNSLEAFQEAAQWPNVWLKADLRLSKDEKWFLYSGQFLEEHTNGKGYPEHKTLEELQSYELGHKMNIKNIRIITLKEFLSRFGHKNLVFFIHSNNIRKLTELLDHIDQLEANERVVIQSSYQTVISKLRKKRPRWLYGITSADFSKLRLFSSLLLEPVASFRGDIVISPEHSYFRGSFLPRMVHEIQRRGGKVLLRTESLDDYNKTKVKHGFNGVMTRHPAFFVESVNINH